MQALFVASTAIPKTEIEFMNISAMKLLSTQQELTLL